MPKLVRTDIEFEAQVTEQVLVVEEDLVRPWSADTHLSVVGQPVHRVDARPKVTGEARYTADISLPGMLYAAVLRCPLPHARVVRLDTSRAEAMPGVRAVLSRQDVLHLEWEPGVPIFGEEVRFHGDEVAAVAADDEYQARDALEAIQVDYQPLPFVLDIEEALAADAPRVRPEGNLYGAGPRRYRRGDVQRGFAEAEVVVEETFRTQAAAHNALEPHCCIAEWEGDRLVLWESTQGVYATRAAVARVLGLSLDQVRVIQEYMGGGFGAKQQSGKFSVIAALLARKAGRPVKLVYTRREDNLVGGYRAPTVHHVRLGARRDGTLTAMQVRSSAAIGAYGDLMAIGGAFVELYRCPNVLAEEVGAYVHRGPSAPFRAPGYVEGTFALESAMDMLADKLGMDPLHLRLKNYAEVDPASGLPYSSKGLAQAYELGAKLIGWDSRRHRQADGRKLRGIGMASQIWGGGGSPPAYALVRIEQDGSATVVTGSQDIGTGTRTGLAQIAAEELGYRLEDVAVSIGDTERGVYAPTSAGSQTISSVGPAVRNAAADARRQLLDLLGQAMGVPLERMRVQEGVVYADGRSFGTVRELAPRLGWFNVIGRGGRSSNPEGWSIRTFGAQFAEVEVNADTGELRVIRVVAVHDSGRIISPLAAGGQVEGGVIQGLGYAIMEEQVVDKSTGLVLNPDLGEYRMPTALDVPEVQYRMLDLPDPLCNNLGARGVGEPPIIPTAPAIANAVSNAIGWRVRDLPITRDKLLEAIHPMRARGGTG